MTQPPNSLAKLREFRVQGDMVQRLHRNGDVQSELPISELQVKVVERRQTGWAVFLLVVATGVGSAAVGFFGLFFGAACAATPVLILGFMAFVAFLKAKYLRLSSDGSSEDWMLDRDLEPEETRGFLRAIRDAQRATNELPQLDDDDPSFDDTNVYHVLFGAKPPPYAGPMRVRMRETAHDDHLIKRLGRPLLSEIERDGISVYRLALLHRIMATRWVAQAHTEDPDQLRSWTRSAACLVATANGELLDPHLRALITANGDAASDGVQIPYPADAIARRAMTLVRMSLDGMGSPTASPVIGDSEVVLRPAEEVARRAMCLGLIVGPLAAGALRDDDMPTMEQLERRFGRVTESLTADERAFLLDPNKDAAERLRWRTESALAMFWAIGWVSEPLSMCKSTDGSSIIAIVDRLQPSPFEAATSASLRPKAELLDALDRVYCHRRLVMTAHANNTSGPPGLKPGVLLEQHAALNWITEFHNRGVDWDHIRCPT